MRIALPSQIFDRYDDDGIVLLINHAPPGVGKFFGILRAILKIDATITYHQDKIHRGLNRNSYGSIRVHAGDRTMLSLKLNIATRLVAGFGAICVVLAAAVIFTVHTV